MKTGTGAGKIGRWEDREPGRECRDRHPRWEHRHRGAKLRYGKEEYREQRGGCSSGAPAPSGVEPRRAGKMIEHPRRIKASGLIY